MAAKQSSPVSKGLSWQRNLLWTSGGTVVYAACSWATLSAIAKMGSPEMLGQYALAVAVATPVLMLPQLNLRAVIATDARGEHGFHDCRGLRVNATLLSLLILAAIAAAGYPGHEAALILAVGIGLAVEGVSDLYYGLMQRHSRMDRITVSLLLRAPLGLAVMTAGIAATGSLLPGAIALVAVRAIVLVLYDAGRGTRDFRALEPLQASGVRNALARQWPIFTLALPLGMVVVMNAAAANLPRYFIEHHLGARELGIFSAAASLITIGGTLVNTVGQSVTPRLARLYTWHGVPAFASFSLRLLGFGALLGAAAVGCAALFGGPALALLFRPEYAEHSSLLVALMAAGAIGYVSSLLGYVVTAARSFRSQVPVFAVVAAATLVSSAILIPSRGLLGAAMAAAIAAGVQLAGLGVIFVRLTCSRRPANLPRAEVTANA